MKTATAVRAALGNIGVTRFHALINTGQLLEPVIIAKRGQYDDAEVEVYRLALLAAFTADEHGELTKRLRANRQALGGAAGAKAALEAVAAARRPVQNTRAARSAAMRSCRMAANDERDSV